MRRVSTGLPEGPGTQATPVPGGTRGFDALPYHRAVAHRVRMLEPASWASFAQAADADDGTGLDEALRRGAYRLDPAAHPHVAAAARRAAAALGVDVPVSTHQLEGGAGANAALLFTPGEAVVTFSGPLLDLLGPGELTAVLGHELAHHVLWRLDGAALLVADRLLDAVALDARTPPVWAETARRWSLATELAADRGALLACGDLRTAVAALVRTTTGLASADPDAFLAQARSVDPAAGAAPGRSHPETVLRAWALEAWSRSPDEGDEAVAAVLGTGLDLEALDLLDRERLETLTRRVVEAMLADPALATDAVLAHARQFFPDVAPTPGAAATFAVPASATDATRRYLAYVLLDLATVDPDLEDGGLRAALALAASTGLGAAVADAAARERLVPAATLDRLVAAAGGPA